MAHKLSLGARTLRQAASNFETLLAVGRFGASSLFWLGLAFFTSSTGYGRIMTIQAVILLVTTLLTFRTHDLLFFLISKYAYDVDQAFLTSFGIEAVAALCSALICSIGVAALGILPGADMLALSGPAIIAAIGSVQGASVAKLRYLNRASAIMRADVFSIASFLPAVVGLLILPGDAYYALLALGLLPNAVRSLALLLWPLGPHEKASGAARWGWCDRLVIGRFLIGAQLTNFFKNGSVSIETAILAAFCPPNAVAMYRLTKSTQGASTAAINIEFQRGYSALARAEDPAERCAVLGRLNRTSVITSLILYPASALFALVYALSKPDVGVLEFQLVTLAMFLAFLPAALQQRHMIVLLQEGAHGSVNLAYTLSVVLLGILSLPLFLAPTIWFFLGALIVSGVARIWILSVRARRYLA